MIVCGNKKYQYRCYFIHITRKRKEQRTKNGEKKTTHKQTNKLRKKNASKKTVHLHSMKNFTQPLIEN